MSLHGTTAIREMVKNGKYCGFIPLSLISNADIDTYYSISRVKDVKFDRAICLYHKKSSPLSPCAVLVRRFILGREWRNYPYNSDIYA